jgi:hypothetical protein
MKKFENRPFDDYKFLNLFGYFIYERPFWGWTNNKDETYRDYIGYGMLRLPHREMTFYFVIKSKR